MRRDVQILAGWTGARIVSEEPLVIQTADQSWSYSAYLDVEACAPLLAGEGRFWFAIKGHCLKGRCGIGLLYGDSLVGELLFAKTEPGSLAHLIIPCAAGLKGVVIRCELEGSSLIQIDGVALLREPSFREQDATGLYDLRCFETAGGTVRYVDDKLEVTTTAAQWAYTAVIPINRVRAPKGSVVRLTLSLEIDAGTLQVGILNEAESSFITTATVEAGPRKMVELVIPRFDRVGRLVLRNASSNGPSHGWCRLLGTTSEPPLP